MILDKPMNVCLLVGSLRKASLSGMLANALISLAPSPMEPEVIEIGQLPFYNQDLERYIDSPPAPWAAFRQRVKAADAVLFVTPEYNRSVPAVLKTSSSTTVTEDSCRRSCERSRIGPRRSGPKVSASDAFSSARTAVR
jgi:hypothetical protein